MKRKLLFIALASVLGLIALAQNKSATGSSESPLQDRVRELESRVKMLESRLGKIESSRTQSAIVVPFRSGTTNVQPLFLTRPPGETRGKVWDERQINGWNYYVVPCEQNASQSR